MSVMIFALFAFLADEAPKKPTRRALDGASTSPNFLFWAVIVLMVVGIGWKAMKSVLARRALRRIEGDRPELEAIRDAATHGRIAIIDLFRLLSTGKEQAVRYEAGRALSTLWKADELVAEEEKALVTRGFEAHWHARRKYPRDLMRPIPFSVSFNVPFLTEEGTGISPHSLEWSARVLGTDRASLEHFEKWHPAGGSKTFEIDPRDRPTNGPHRVIVDVKVRTVGLTSDWEHTLPQIPFTFEFDPILRPEALLASQDDERAARLASAIQLSIDGAESDAASFVPIDAEFALRGTPQLLVKGPLPCDLAHAISLEIEGITGRIEAGGIVMTRESLSSVIGLELSGERRPSNLERPGSHRIRAILTPDVHRGWGDPAVRSVWSGTIVTEWVEVRIVRR